MKVHERLRVLGLLLALPAVSRVHERPGERDAEVDVVGTPRPLEETHPKMKSRSVS